MHRSVATSINATSDYVKQVARVDAEKRKQLFLFKNAAAERAKMPAALFSAINCNDVT